MERHDVPVIAFTMGEPGGIGFEVVSRAIASFGPRPPFVPVLVGVRRVAERWHDMLSSVVPADELVDPAAWPELTGSERPVAPVMASLDDPGAPVSVGRFEAEWSPSVVASIDRAITLAKAGIVDAMVTAPIDKRALVVTGGGFLGQTELLAARVGVDDVAMVFWGTRLRATPLTTHVPVGEVPSRFTRDLVTRQVTLVNRFMQEMGIATPRLALCALNPHAGDDGLAGTEDDEVGRPAVASLVDRGVDIIGPVPADSVFTRALGGEVDMVLTPTHDQATIPMKLMEFDSMVNATVGLGFLRTSPGHGVAYDIAGRAVADVGSTIAATRLCLEWHGKAGRAGGLA